MSGELTLTRRGLLAGCGWLCVSRGLSAADHLPHVTAVAFAAENNRIGDDRILVGSQAGVSVLDSSGKVLRSLSTELHNVHDLCFSPDGRLIAVGRYAGRVGCGRIFRLADW